MTMKNKELVSIITNAALARDDFGKKMKHQKRINNETLGVFKERMLKKEHEISEARSFPELLQIVESCRVFGIGELTCYDVATRIGFFLGIEPDAVYLHAGTKKGAENLLGRKYEKK